MSQLTQRPFLQVRLQSGLEIGRRGGQDVEQVIDEAVVESAGASGLGRVAKSGEALRAPSPQPSADGGRRGVEQVGDLRQRAAFGREQDGVGALALAVGSSLLVQTGQGLVVGARKSRDELHALVYPSPKNVHYFCTIT